MSTTSSNDDINDTTVADGERENVTENPDDSQPSPSKLRRIEHLRELAGLPTYNHEEGDEKHEVNGYEVVIRRNPKEPRKVPEYSLFTTKYKTFDRLGPWTAADIELVLRSVYVWPLPANVSDLVIVSILSHNNYFRSSSLET